MSRNSQAGSGASKFACLWVGIGPVFVLLLATCLFEWIAPGAAQGKQTPAEFLSSSTPPPASPSVQSQAQGQIEIPDLQAVLLREASARYAWLTTVLLNLFISCLAVVVFFRVALRGLAGRLRLLAGVVLLLLSVAGIATLLLNAANEGALHRFVFGFTYDALRLSGLYSEAFLGRVLLLVTTINVLAVIAPNCALIACVSPMAPRRRPRANGDDPLKELVTRNRLLRETINAAAALLVSGILHMGGWLHWSTTLVSDPAVRAGLEQITLWVSLYWGMTFSLMIAAAYLPATYLMREEALRLRGETGAEVDAEKWLKQEGFKLSLGEQLPQIAMLFAPVLAGPAATLFGSLADFAG